MNSLFHKISLPIYLVCMAVGLEIPTVQAGEAEILRLKNGETLTGTNLGLLDGNLEWELPRGTRIWIAFDQIQAVEYTESDLPELISQEGQQEDSPSSSYILDELTEQSSEILHSATTVFEEAYEQTVDHVADWTKRMEVGARFIDGNSNERYFNLGGQFEKMTDVRSIQMDFSGNFGENNGERSVNRWIANGTVDFDREGNKILFVTTKNEYDELENLDYRGTLSGGLGYRFFNEKNKRLITRIGPAYTQEIFHDPVVKRSTPDLFGELELRWPVFWDAQFNNKTNLHPSVENFNVFRLTSTSGLLFKLDDAGRWKLKFGFRYEYNSKPNLGRKPSDFTSNISVVYKRG